MLSVKRLSFQYPGHAEAVLRKLSFELNAGTVTGVAGHSGSGKSTLLRLLYGTYDPAQGEMLFEGQRVEGPADKLVTGHPAMKLVAQVPDPEEAISIFENLTRKLLSYRKSYRHEKAEALLHAFGLYAFRNRKPGEISGGQRQLLAIAAALAEEPRLLLLDEPFNQLDRASKENALHYIRTLVDTTQMAVLWVSHEGTDLLGYCDSLFIMEKGKIRVKGSPRELYYAPSSAYEAGLLGVFSEISHRGETRFLRPCQLEVTEKSARSLSVTVSHSVFRGEYTEVHALSGKAEKIIFQAAGKSYRKGETVWLRIKRKS